MPPREAGQQTKMRAVVHEEYGPPSEILAVREIDRPAIADDEVLVRVHAAGVDQGVWHLVAGMPHLIRLMGVGLRRPKYGVPGMDVAGTVSEVGTTVTGFRPGDEVFGTCVGSYAEYARARPNKLAPKPANLTFEQAAAVPVSAITALQGLRDKGRVRPGQHVLVIGAGGGVGTSAVQLAKAFGAKVTGMCSTAKVDLVRSIGADDVIDYTREDITSGKRRFDVILDTGGNRPLSDLRRVLTPRGTLVIVGAEERGRLLQGTDRQLRALALSPFVRQNLRSLFSSQREADLHVLREFIEAGKVAPIVDRTFSLSEVPEAIQYMRERRVRGKLVISV
jgi:NADPH:quinone reductase-like Zn-dependent oxidoreductase